MDNHIGTKVWTPEGSRAERVFIIGQAPGLPAGWYRCKCEDGQINAINQRHLYLTRAAALRNA
jgi:hypothetical protein